MRRCLILAPLLVFGLAACAPETTTPNPTPTAAPTSASPTPTPSPTPMPTPQVTTPSAPATSAAPVPSASPSPVAPSPVASPTPTPSPAAPSAPASTPPTSGSGEWQDTESEASSAAQAADLAGVPESFRTFVAAAMSAPDADGCTTTNVSVMSVHPSGFVLGSESSDCGGGQVIWADQGGGWERLFVMQAPPLCEELESAGVPTGVGLQCLDGEDLVGY